VTDPLDLSILGLSRHLSADLRPNYIATVSAWLGHGPFAMWLVKTAKPRVVVELGTHFGYSYFAMCQAVQGNRLKTKCYAVDTWQGDEHAGHYDESVFESVVTHNHRYKRFSTLLRKRFDQALADIPDGSVDLLHVDGRHFYEDVKEDFESWVPKLSKRAIVLFHDTEVVGRNFGVKQYWQELHARYDGFGFEHSHGLGVLFFGTEANAAVTVLKQQLARPNGLADLQRVFAELGAAVSQDATDQPMPQKVEDTFFIRLRRMFSR